MHPNFIINGINKNTTTFKIILLLRHLDSTIYAHSDILQPYTINLLYTPLEKILGSYPLYPTFKRQICSKHIIFLEQLMLFDNTTLLVWNYISPRIGFLIPGKTPE